MTFLPPSALSENASGEPLPSDRGVGDRHGHGDGDGDGVDVMDVDETRDMDGDA
jgi:hypothetical protein